MEENNLSMRLAAVIDTAIDGIITIDSKGKIESVNKSAANIFGFNPSELIGKNVSVLMGKDHRDKHDGYINRYMITKVPRIIGIGRELYGRKKTGELFPFRLAVSEVILHDKIIFTGIIHDLTEVVKANEKIEKLNRELEKKVVARTIELEDVVNKLLKSNTELELEIEKRKEVENKLRKSEIELTASLDKEIELNTLKSRFVSIASHEFRTPLTTILSSAQLLSKYQKSQEQVKREKHISKIVKAVNNLTGILNDFLSLSKIEEGKLLPTINEFQLTSLLYEIKEDLSLILKDGQDIKIYIEGDDMINSDEKILKNILFNLISNSIKYSVKDIEVRVVKANGGFKIDVVDYGIGIPQEEQKYLFTRFFRSSNAENIEGTGLGLTIVKLYLEKIKGEIEFESKLNVGSRFSISINDLKNE